MKLSLFTQSDLVGIDLPDDCLEILNNLEKYVGKISYERSFDYQLAEIHQTAVIEGNVYIAPGAVIKAHAYIRGPVYVGANCIVGHCSEVKNSVLLAGSKVAHFNYVGDSILCEDVNLGAGTKIANVRLDNKNVRVLVPDKEFLEHNLLDTQRRKFGAILADKAQTGCNSVLSPGSILLAGSTVAPCEHFKGTR